MPAKRKAEKAAKVESNRSSSPVAEPTVVLGTKEFFALEDEITERSTSKEDVLLFHETTENLSNLLTKYHDVARKTTTSGQETQLLDSLQVDIMLAVTQLRRLNRLSHFRNKKLRDRVSEERQKVEEKYLQLQNLLYEVSHIEKEVEKCLEFKSDHEDIEMIPIEQFYNEAPETVSKPAITKQDAHSQRLARLNWELETRKQLEVELENKRKEKAEFLKEILTTENQLSTLQPKLETLLETSKPLQEALDMNYEREAVQFQYATYLPSCLYYLYIQALAYKEVFDKYLQITIEGDLDRVKKMVNDQRNAAINSEEDEESDSSESESESQTHMAEHHFQSQVGRKRRTTVTEALELKHASDITEPFPLYVVLKINYKSKATIFLKFFFVEYLGVVSVKSRLELMADIPRAVASANDLMADETMLVGLFAGDTGVTCPSPTGAVKLNHTKFDLKSKVDICGRLYDWAQRLAGLNFPESTDTNDGFCSRKSSDNDVGSSTMVGETRRDAEDGCQYFQTVLKLVKRRTMARLSLQEQFAAFESLNVHPPNEIMAWFPARIYSRMIQWSSLTYDDFVCHPASKGYRQMVDEDGWFCNVSIERGSAKLTALIYIHMNYPDITPLFCLLLNRKEKVFTADKCGDIWHLARAVNTECVANMPKKLAYQTLCVQLQFLISRLDVVLEIRSFEQGDKEFSMEHSFQSLRRGRDRRLPFWKHENRNCYTFDKP